jgi:hypothetical protein
MGKEIAKNLFLSYQKSPWGLSSGNEVVASPLDGFECFHCFVMNGGDQSWA